MYPGSYADLPQSTFSIFVCASDSDPELLTCGSLELCFRGADGHILSNIEPDLSRFMTGPSAIGDMGDLVNHEAIAEVRLGGLGGADRGALEVIVIAGP